MVCGESHLGKLPSSPHAGCFHQHLMHLPHLGCKMTFQRKGACCAQTGGAGLDFGPLHLRHTGGRCALARAKGEDVQEGKAAVFDQF